MIEYYNFNKSELEKHSRIPLIVKKNNEEIFYFTCSRNGRINKGK